jgi:hypothetical protein
MSALTDDEKKAISGKADVVTMMLSTAALAAVGHVGHAVIVSIMAEAFSQTMAGLLNLYMQTAPVDMKQSILAFGIEEAERIAANWKREYHAKQQQIGEADRLAGLNPNRKIM